MTLVSIHFFFCSHLCFLVFCYFFLSLLIIALLQLATFFTLVNVVLMHLYNGKFWRVLFLLNSIVARDNYFSWVLLDPRSFLFPHSFGYACFLLIFTLVDRREIFKPESTYAFMDRCSSICYFLRC